MCVTALLIFSGQNLIGQDFIKKQLPQPDKYEAEKIIDPIYGVTMYSNLNFRLGGDSCRYCLGYSCDGWVEDFYTDGKLLHKGYYVEGRLKIYKNYFPSGQLEREFRIIDDYKSMMRLYYDDGTKKSEVKYTETEPFRWQDFFPNGQLEYYEEYNKSMEYFIAQKSYFQNGKPQSIMELENKKKLTFTKKEYYSNGNVKDEGMIRYNTDLLDYQKIDKWMHYDESGTLKRDTYYENGVINREKEY